MHNFARLRDFLDRFGALLDEAPEETAILAQGGQLLGELISVDDWLPAAYARPDPERYQQYLLHADARQRFSLVSFVWGPGQQTPIHDHRCWGVMGVAVGAIQSVSFYPLQSGALVPGPAEETPYGSCVWIHPEGGDIHRVGAAGAEAAVSIHVYGTRFSRVCRNRYLPDGTVQPR